MINSTVLIMEWCRVDVMFGEHWQRAGFENKFDNFISKCDGFLTEPISELVLN